MIVGIARQGDSLDSVEGESSLPYDSVPIRLEQTGLIFLPAFES